MSDKEKRPALDEYEELTREILREKVREAFRNNPRNPTDKLEELGFEYFDDEVDEEEQEELNAKPENQRQRQLVAHFSSHTGFSPKIFEIYSKEKSSECPNYPLLRKYFRTANPSLKSLLIYGLENYPERLDLLDDLSFFHEFENVLDELITYYTQACLNHGNLEIFTELAKDFYYATIPDGYEAYHALRELYEPETAEREIIDFLIAEEEETTSNCPPVN